MDLRHIAPHSFGFDNEDLLNHQTQSGMKTSNDYKDVLSGEFFDKTPKAVFAAMAVSYASRQFDEDFSKVEEELKREWKALHEAGIVPQKPIK